VINAAAVIGGAWSARPSSGAGR